MIGDELRSRILAVMEQNEQVCDHDLRCLDLPAEQICSARWNGLEDYLACLDDHPQQCKFAVPLGDGYLCRCHARRLLHNHLGI